MSHSVGEQPNSLFKTGNSRILSVGSGWFKVGVAPLNIVGWVIATDHAPGGNAKQFRGLSLSGSRVVHDRVLSSSGTGCQTYSIFVSF